MRRRRCRLATALLVGALLCWGAPPLQAQRDLSTEGALFLLLPVGARAAGAGQAVVADEPGSEAIWWNPAGLARLESREAAIHHSRDFISTGDALTLVIPSSLVGVLGASLAIRNFGEQDVTNEGGKIGEILIRGVVYAATYATAIGTRVNAGLNYKLVQFRLDCSGDCSVVNTVTATSSALDAGLQYRVRTDGRLTVGAVVRNVGPQLQVRDSPQADPLPSRVQVGVLHELRPFRIGGSGETVVRLSADLLDRLRFRNPSPHFGVDLAWDKRVHLRGGVIYESAGGAQPSIGLGVAAGSFSVDLARIFEGFSAQEAQPPTFLSLRYLF